MRSIVSDRRSIETVISEGRYSVRLAASADEIDRALKLRFEVFNLELGEGMESSFITERDSDAHDLKCDHLIAVENSTNEIVGTYRLQTLEAVGTPEHFYSAAEFDLSTLPSDFHRNAIEIGRACIAKDHRNTKVLFLLWKALATMLKVRNKRYLFGCCSLTSQDPADGIRAFARLDAMNATHRKFWVEARSGYQCRTEGLQPESELQLPKLFGSYLRFGAKTISGPAIDREFGTIDFLVIFDREETNELARRMFFS